VIPGTFKECHNCSNESRDHIKITIILYIYYNITFMPIETYYSTRILLLYEHVVFHSSMLSVNEYIIVINQIYLKMRVTLGYYYSFFWGGEGCRCVLGILSLLGKSVCNELQYLTTRVYSYINNINSRCSIDIFTADDEVR